MNPTQIERFATVLHRWKSALLVACILLAVLGLAASKYPDPTRSTIVVAYLSGTAAALVLPAWLLVFWFAVPPALPAVSLYRRLLWPGKAFAVFSTVLFAAKALLIARFSYLMLSALP